MRRKRFGDSTGDEKVLLGRYAATQCRHCAVQPVLLRPLALTGASQWLAGLHTAPLPAGAPAGQGMRGCSHGARLPVRVLERYCTRLYKYSYQVLPPDSTWKAPCRLRGPAPEVRTDQVAASIFAACFCAHLLAGTSAKYERWSTAAGPSRFIAAAHPIGRGQGKAAAGRGKRDGMQGNMQYMQRTCIVYSAVRCCYQYYYDVLTSTTDMYHVRMPVLSCAVSHVRARDVARISCSSRWAEYLRGTRCARASAG